MRTLLPAKYIKPLLWAGFVMQLVIQDVNAQSNQQKIAVYTEADGLSSSIIRCVLQDSRGMLWIGTPDGLNYYDGYIFKTFRKSSTEPNTIKENFITKLTEDLVGDIWIGYLQGGVSCYNISTGIFRHYPLKQYSDDDHLRIPEVTMLFATKNNDIWISTVQHGIYKLDKHSGRYTQFNLVNENGTSLTAANDKAYNTVYAAYEDETGKIWLATAAGLYDLDPSTSRFTIHRKTPLKAGEANHEDYLCIKRRDNKFWLGSWSGGLASYEPATNKWNHFRYAPLSPADNIILDIWINPGDSITFISNDRGLGYFDTRSEKFLFPEDNVSIKSGDYKSIYKDRYNNIWITSTKGLIKMQKTKPKFSFSPLPVSISTNGDFYNVSVAFENDQFLLLGTSYSDGLHIRSKATGNEQAVAFETLPGEEKHLVVTDIFQDSQNTIWVLTRDYIYYLNLTTMRLEKRSQPALAANGVSNYLFKIQEGNDGNLWIASLRNGLFLYDKAKDEFIRHYTPEGNTASFIPTTYVRGLYRDKKGVIWTGGGKGFLGSIDEQSGRVHPHRTYFPKEAVNINTVYDITGGDSDTLWVGTDAGLIQFKTTSKEPELQRSYTSENGIASDMVHSIARADDGSIWCITQTSLCRLNPYTGVVASYGPDDGLENAGLGERIQLSSNGSMFLGAVRGYYVFDPVHVARLQQPPPILVTSFAVNGLQRYYTSELATKGIINLKPSENRISFEFASINFSSSARQQYAYMLEGLDTGWTSTYNRYASYANLQQGAYAFKLRAIGGIHQENSELIVVPMYVSGYFYESAWFRILVTALLLSVVYLVYSIRLHNQKRLFQLQARAGLLEKEKALIMYENLKQQLNPHFLFNSLTSLSSLIRIDQKLAGEFLDGLSNTYRYILNSRDKDLVPLSEEIRFCEIYIKLQRTRFRNALQVTFHVKEEHLHLKLPAVTLQNMLENAIKHNVLTEDEPLMIDISTNESSQLEISNNLNKKPFVETSNRKGLASLHALYTYLSDKKIDIIETADRFTIKIPLI